MQKPKKEKKMSTKNQTNKSERTTKKELSEGAKQLLEFLRLKEECLKEGYFEEGTLGSTPGSRSRVGSRLRSGPPGSKPGFRSKVQRPKNPTF